MTAKKAEWIKALLADEYWTDADVVASLTQSGLTTEDAARYVAIRELYLEPVMPTVGASIRAVFAGGKTEAA